MTLMCIDRSQSPTHKSSFLQGRKSPVNNHNNHNHNNNNSSNINQHNNTNNNNNNHHHHHRRNSCSPPLSKDNNNKSQSNPDSPRKLERSTSDPVQQQDNNNTGNRRGSSVQNGATNSSRYKTELCRPFEENGTCKYGDKCQFAHGSKELRSMARHPKYKTELCRTFHSTGLCPYGPRCHFIHNSEQSKKSLLTNLTNTVPPPMVRQKALSSLGSAGDISPVSSHGGSPTGIKSFDDLYKQQQPPVSAQVVSPILLTQSLISNLNNSSSPFAADVFQEAFNNFIQETDDPVVLDNYSMLGSYLSDCYWNPPIEEPSFLRSNLFNRILSKN